MKENKVCEECGRLFTPNTTRQLTCSQECGKIRHARMCKERYKKTIEKICAECGEKFLTSNRNRIACSPQCARKHATMIRKYRGSYPVTKKKTAGIGETEQLARKAGLTYGKYVALQYAKGGR